MLIELRPARAFVLMCAASLTCCSGALAASDNCFTYTAVAGDTLIGIGERYLAKPGDWPQVGRLNGVRQPRRIPVGTPLCLPEHLLKSTPRPGVVLDVVGTATRVAAPATGQPPSEAQVIKGDVIAAGMKLRTSTNGYVTVQLADGSILKVQANTEARLESSQQYEAAGFFASVWSVLQGRVESLVSHLTGGKPRYQIKTPQAVLGVRGTEFRVQTDGRRTLGETLKGSVLVSNSQDAELIVAGQGTIAQAGQGVAAPLPLPPAPDVSRLPTLYERVLLKLDLPPVPGASSYRVQVAEDADFRRVRAEVTAAQPPLRITDLPDGDYFLRARVADAQGLEGPDAVQQFKLKARPEPPIPVGPANKAKVRDKAVTMSWSAHPEAVSYRLQVARDAAFTQLLAERTDIKDTQARIELPAGDHHWRLASTRFGPDHGPWGDPMLVLLRDPPAQPPPPKLTADSLSFELQAEPGQRFEFQLAGNADFQPVQQDIATEASTVVIPRPAEGGRLYVRYRAIDADGYIGPYTRPQLVALPTCVRSSTGRCITSGGRFVTSQP